MSEENIDATMRPIDDIPCVCALPRNLLAFIESMNEIFFLVDEDRTIVAASPLAKTILGLDEKGGGWRIDDFFPKVYLDAIFSRVNGRDVRDMGLTFPVKDVKGREVLLETRFNWTPIGDRDVLSLSCRDINQYVETISDLTEREDRYRTIFHEAPLGFVYINSDGCIADCNSAFLSIFGMIRDEILGVCLAEKSGIGIYPRFRQAAMDALAGLDSSHESPFQSGSGGVSGWVRVTSSPVKSDNQVFLGGGRHRREHYAGEGNGR